MSEVYADDTVVVHGGDCLDVLRELDAESVDSVVTDPPYSLGFMGKSWDAHRELDDDPAFGYYLAGLIDGEGCFRVQGHERGTYACTFTLKLRADDEAILRRAMRWLGAGTIASIAASGTSNPTVRWAVQDKEGCQRLIDALDKYELRAKKRNDYLAWREAVCEWTDRPRGNRWHGPADQSRMAALKARIEDARGYTVPAWSGDGYQDWCRLWATECLRVLKPGGHLLAFGGARTWHRLACAVEDAGFEMRDSIAWLYGSGFPKSLDVSKAIDKAAGAEREVVGRRTDRAATPKRDIRGGNYIGATANIDLSAITAPATDDARAWQGWGTALKPAFEPIVVARKPFRGTVAGNVLEHGTGALNVDGTRVRMTPADRAETEAKNRHADWGSPNGGKDTYGDFTMTPRDSYDGSGGRWPSNLLLSHGPGCVLRGQAVVRGDGHTPATRGPGGLGTAGHAGQDGIEERTAVDELVEDWACEAGCPVGLLGVEARFFPTFRYQVKAPGHERPGSTDVDGQRVAHPTVKPLDLMRWLVRLVTPPGGTVLDPFLGSGTTAEACVVEGMRCVGIERHEPYHALIRARLSKPIATVLW